MTKRYFWVESQITYKKLYAFSTEQNDLSIAEIEKTINEYNPFELETFAKEPEKVTFISWGVDEEQFLKEHDKKYPEMKDADPKDKLMLPNLDVMHKNKVEV